MSPELDQSLCQKYPLIFKPREQYFYAASGAPEVLQAPPMFGFECDDGWFDLIDTACSLIYWESKQAEDQYLYRQKHEGKPPYKGAEVMSASKVEEARLAMQEAQAQIPQALQVKEKFGTMRFYASGGSETARAYIQFAESYSAKTCELCGGPGKLRSGGWLRTLCDAHAPPAQVKPLETVEAAAEVVNADNAENTTPPIQND